MAEHAPVILCFSGLDPSGGAGIQADIEAIAANGGHAAPVITASTQQDTRGVYAIQPVDADFIQQQARVILEDMSVDMIKIGMLGSLEVAEAVAGVVRSTSQTPVVLDPVLAAGSGDSLSSESLIAFIREQLLPHCQVATPNTLEAMRLAPEASSPEDAAALLSANNSGAILLTGSHASSQDIHHKLYQEQQLVKQYDNPRLPGEFHGSGCTLAASLACHLVSAPLETACQQALDYTCQSLLQARALGRGQLIPGRIQSKRHHNR